MSGAVRDAAALAAALGVLALLVPVPGLHPGLRRLAGLAALVAAWIVLAAGLVPSGDIDALGDRLSSPGPLTAAVAAAGLCVVALWYGARVVLRHPVAWFALLGVALPLRIPVPIGGEDRNLLLPLYVLIAVGVAAWVWHRVRGRIPADADPVTPVDLPLAAFVAYSLASIAWSVDSEEGAVKAVFFYIPFVLLFLAVVAWWPRPRARALVTLTAATIGLATAVAVLAVVQYQTREIFLNERLQQANVYSRFFRTNAIFYDPNILGRYLVVAIVAVVAVAWLMRDRPRVLLALAVPLVPLCAGLAVTFSRSSCLMLMTAMLMMGWWAFGTRRTLAVAGATLALIGGAALVGSGNVRSAATDTDRLEKVSEGRFDLMRGGLQIWWEAPVAGAGLGGFETQYQRTLTPAEQRRVRVIISHNTPVTVLSELGLAGFALYLVLGVAGVTAIWRRARRSAPVPGWAQWTILALLVGIVVHALLYSAQFEDPFTWALSAAAMALGAGAVVRDHRRDGAGDAAGVPGAGTGTPVAPAVPGGAG